MEPLFAARPRRNSMSIAATFASIEEPEDAELAGLNILTMTSSGDAKHACHDLCRDPLVEYAYVPPERVVEATRRRRRFDPLRSRQWGLAAVELAAAQRSAGFVEATDVVVAVIDSGVDPSHPDLAGAIGESRNFTNGSRKDTSGHGTHVTGIIAARAKNRLGITGLCQTQNVLCLKALDPYSARGYYRALRYAMTEGARVVNLSIGGPYDRTEELLIKMLIRNEIAVVAAMGNEFEEGNPKSYPATVRGVIAVGATDENDRRASFSNTGRHIHLSAPGQSILSTIPTYPSSLADGTDYEAWPGTSMATPFVTATVALCLAKRPAATLAKIRTSLDRGADKTPGQRRFNTRVGHGRLNLKGTLAAI